MIRPANLCVSWLPLWSQIWPLGAHALQLPQCRATTLNYWPQWHGSTNPDERKPKCAKCPRTWTVALGNNKIASRHSNSYRRNLSSEMPRAVLTSEISCHIDYNWSGIGCGAGWSDAVWKVFIVILGIIFIPFDFKISSVVSTKTIINLHKNY